MSDEETITVDSSNSKILSAQYKDGQLQIVEVTPFDIKKETHIVPDQIQMEGKYAVVETDKGMMQLDLLNLTLVKCEDGEESYQLVSRDGEDMPTDGSVTCVLQSSDDVEDHKNQDSYVMMQNAQGCLMLVPSQPEAESSSQSAVVTKVSKKPPTPAEILEKAKALQKSKSILSQLSSVSPGQRGRKRKGDLPPPHELLASPNFKLYLYSCKICSFKCNAVKELSAHKAEAHGSAAKLRAMRGNAGLQCPRCPYKASTPYLLEQHSEWHDNDSNSNSDFEAGSERLTLDSLEVVEADVLVCGACGFESPSKEDFRAHIEINHQRRGSDS